MKPEVFNELEAVISDFKAAGSSNNQRWRNAVRRLSNLLHHPNAPADLYTIWKSSMCANEDLIILSLQLIRDREKNLGKLTSIRNDLSRLDNADSAVKLVRRRIQLLIQEF